MKKILTITGALLCCASVATAYNPPVGGEYVYYLTSPVIMTGGASATGGADYNVVPSSIIFNPAITGPEQRTVGDISATLLLNSNKEDLPGCDDNSAGFGFQLGTIIPTRYTVFTGTVQGLFADFNNMKLRKSLSMHLGSSKEIIENQFYVGMNLYGAYYLGEGSDFTAGVDFGALYLLQEDVGFLSDIRFGAALLNCGKPLDGYPTFGVKGEDYSFSDEDYPGTVTPRLSAAATLFKLNNMTGAMSADVSFPACHNAVFDLSYAMSFFDVIHLTAGWSVNILELAEKDYGCPLPTIGLSCKFIINSGKLGKADWAQSEITPALAMQELYNGITAVSAGAKINLGLADTTAPEIILWDEE